MAEKISAVAIFAFFVLVMITAISVEAKSNPMRIKDLQISDLLDAQTVARLDAYQKNFAATYRHGHDSRRKRAIMRKKKSLKFQKYRFPLKGMRSLDSELKREEYYENFNKEETTTSGRNMVTIRVKSNKFRPIKNYYKPPGALRTQMRVKDRMVMMNSWRAKSKFLSQYPAHWSSDMQKR